MKKSHNLHRSMARQSINAKKITKPSSQLWLNRQLNDIYVQAAKHEGYYSRAAYKLIEINQKFKILKQDMKVIDLGAAPGGWSQVVAKIIFRKRKRIHSSSEVTQEAPQQNANKQNMPQQNAQLIAVDLLPIKSIEGVTPIEGDFTSVAIVEQILQQLGGKADMVLSDLSPNTTGSNAVDHIRIMNLVTIAFEFAISVLQDNGIFVAKVFQGGTSSELLVRIKKHFKKVSHFKPPASRKESKEIYLVAIGFRNDLGDKTLGDETMQK